jgi:hypothetical protein
MGTKLGLEWLEEAFPAPDGWRETESDGTVLIVGAIWGSVDSSSEYVVGEPSFDLDILTPSGAADSGNEDLLELGSSSHSCGGVFAASNVDERSHGLALD